MDTERNGVDDAAQIQQYRKSPSQYILIEMLQDEIAGLKETINKQSDLLREKDVLFSNMEEKHAGEVNALQHKIADFTSTVRDSVVATERERREEQQLLAGIHAQLAAATKLIATLQSQVATLSTENQALKRQKANPASENSALTSQQAQLRPADVQIPNSAPRRTLEAGNDWPRILGRTPHGPHSAAHSSKAAASIAPGGCGRKWWSAVAASAEGEFRQWAAAGGTPMAGATAAANDTVGTRARRRLWASQAAGPPGLEELLGAIGAVYAEKTAADALADRDGLPRLPLREFLLAHHLRAAAGARAARAAVVRLVAGVLAHLRGDEPKARASRDGPEPADAAWMSFRGGLSETLRGGHPRVALFARFLGLEPAAAAPIGLDGLGVYLAGLRLLTRGAVGDVPGDGATLPLSEVAAAVEWALGGAPAAVRERARGEVERVAFFDRSLAQVRPPCALPRPATVRSNPGPRSACVTRPRDPRPRDPPA